MSLVLQMQIHPKVRLACFRHKAKCKGSTVHNISPSHSYNRAIMERKHNDSSEVSTIKTQRKKLVPDRFLCQRIRSQINRIYNQEMYPTCKPGPMSRSNQLLPPPPFQGLTSLPALALILDSHLPTKWDLRAGQKGNKWWSLATQRDPCLKPSPPRRHATHKVL